MEEWLLFDGMSEVDLHEWHRGDSQAPKFCVSVVREPRTPRPLYL